jgi:hypothetical protein
MRHDAEVFVSDVRARFDELLDDRALEEDRAVVIANRDVVEASALALVEVDLKDDDRSRGSAASDRHRQKSTSGPAPTTCRASDEEPAAGRGVGASQHGAETYVSRDLRPNPKGAGVSRSASPS